MKKGITSVLVLFLAAGWAFAEPQTAAFEELPSAPQLDHSSAWLAEEYTRKFEPQSLMPGSQLPDLRNWESLKQLSKGKKIRVVDSAFKKSKGRFIDASGQYLKFKANGKEVTLDRASVRMVALRTGPSVGERILMGLLEGAVVGAVTYAEASLCEKHGCQDERTGEWYEGSGKGLSARSGYIATGVGAAGLGILAAFAETEDVVIYFQQERIASIEVPTEIELAPFEPSPPEGGNMIAPVKEGQDTRAAKEDNVQ